MRELRHRLRHYLARVEGGSAFEVTLFGRPVAFLGPLGRQRTMARLVEEGKVTLPTNPDTSELPELAQALGGSSATEALLAERRSDLR